MISAFTKSSKEVGANDKVKKMLKRGYYTLLGCVRGFYSGFLKY